MLKGVLSGFMLIITLLLILLMLSSSFEGIQLTDTDSEKIGQVSIVCYEVPEMSTTISQTRVLALESTIFVKSEWDVAVMQPRFDRVNYERHFPSNVTMINATSTMIEQK